MKTRFALALVFSSLVLLFSQSGGWIRYYQLYSGDRRGNGAKIQMATGTPAAGALAIYDASGNVAPKAAGAEGYALTISSGAPEWVAPASSGTTIPAGAVMTFNLSACPSGWADYTAAQGRYIVGWQSGGTVGGTVGTALTAGENRTVGLHTHVATVDSHAHAINDPGHSHTLSRGSIAGTTLVSGSSSAVGTVSSSVGYTGITSTELTQPGATVSTTGSVVGTSAPYIQLRMCQKN